MPAPRRGSSAGRAAMLTIRPPRAPAGPESRRARNAATAAAEHKKHDSAFMRNCPTKSVADISREMSATDFVGQFRMNALSCFLCSAAAVAAFRARRDSGPAGARGGRIVNIAARPALEPRLGAGMVAYTASKSAVAALTQALAQETTDEEIWVNAVAPSVLDTPANRAAMPDADPRRWVAPADLAEIIVFLASPANRVTRGAVIPVYGGS